MSEEKKPGVVKKTMFSCPEALLEKAEEEVIKEVRERTGYKLTRSKFIQALLEIAIEHKDNLQAENIFDQGSLKKELTKAFKK